jgi:hypothetical protein
MKRKKLSAMFFTALTQELKNVGRLFSLPLIQTYKGSPHHHWSLEQLCMDILLGYINHHSRARAQTAGSLFHSNVILTSAFHKQFHTIVWLHHKEHFLVPTLGSLN